MFCLVAQNLFSSVTYSVERKAQPWAKWFKSFGRQIGEDIYELSA
jgi:hypothetical protein